MTGRGIHFLLVDALNLIRRVYAGQPEDDGPERVAAGRQATLQSLGRALRECEPTHAVSVFDGPGPSWRHELHPEYKAGRKPMPEALAEALPAFRTDFASAGVETIERPSLEADDMIATMATKAAAAGARVTILSTDKAFLQLLPHGIRVRDHFQGVDHDRDWVREKFRVEPHQFVDYLALAGDRGNGIPGVTGVGPKRASELLETWGDLESVLAASSEILGKLGEHLRDEAEIARLSHRLAELRADLDLGIRLSQLRLRPPTPT